MTTTIEEDKVALSTRRAAEVINIPTERLSRWIESGLVNKHAHRPHGHGRNAAPVFQMDDLVEARMFVVIVEHGVDPRTIRHAVNRATNEEFTRPLIQLAWAVTDSKDVIHSRPYDNGTWFDDREQSLLHQFLRPVEIRAQVLERLSRRQGKPGTIEKRRGVCGGKPVFAGTRIPLSTIAAYLKSEVSDEEILEDYPDLAQPDIDVARRHFEERRAS